MIYLLLDLSLCTEIVLLNEIPSQPAEVKQTHSQLELSEYNRTHGKRIFIVFDYTVFLKVSQSSKCMKLSLLKLSLTFIFVTLSFVCYLVESFLYNYNYNYMSCAPEAKLSFWRQNLKRARARAKILSCDVFPGPLALKKSAKIKLKYCKRNFH